MRCILWFILGCALIACGGDDTGTACQVDLDCEDGNTCTLDICVSGSCIFTSNVGLACDDGNACSESSTCTLDAACEGGTEIAIEETPCTVCSCDPESGVECVARNIGDPCSDSDCCTSNDFCDACSPDDPNCSQYGVMCVGELKDCDDDNQCTNDDCSCEAGEAICSNDNEPNGFPCVEDENACTEGDFCQGGQCLKGTPLNLDDGNPCTQDTCVKGEVVNDPLLDGQCDDGNECTSNDYCFLGTCTGGDPVECETLSCAASVECKTGEGCVYSWQPEGAICDDENVSTANDHCDADGKCIGDPIECPATGNCISEFSFNGTDCTPVYASSGTSCDDDDLNTKNDQCDDLGGCAGEAIVCPDLSDCITAYTPNGSDCSPSFESQGTSCDDQNLCTVDDTCSSAGVCQPGPPLECALSEEPCITMACEPSTGTCAPTTTLNCCGNGIVELGEECDNPACCGCTLSELNPLGCVLGNTGVETTTQALHFNPCDSCEFFNERPVSSISMRGNRLAFGAVPNYYYTHPDSVFVTELQDGVWSTQQEINGSTPGLDFGWSVGLSDDTLVVGVPRVMENGQLTGLVSIFTLENGSWTEQQELFGSYTTVGNGSISDRGCGISVAIEENTLVFGCAGGTSYPSVHVYDRIDGTWSFSTKLAPFDGFEINGVWQTAGYRFGAGVSLSGDWLAVAATTDGTGAIYLYKRSGSDWGFMQKIDAPEGASPGFGGYHPPVGGNSTRSYSRLSLVGDYLVVGTHGNQNTAYVYVRDGDTWALQQTLSPNRLSGVALSNQTLALTTADPWSVSSGVNLYHLTEGAWKFWKYLPPPIPSFLGAPIQTHNKVAIDGNRVAAGVYYGETCGDDACHGVITHRFNAACATANMCDCKETFLGATCAECVPATCSITWVGSTLTWESNGTSCELVSEVFGTSSVACNDSLFTPFQVDVELYATNSCGDITVCSTD